MVCSYNKKEPSFSNEELLLKVNEMRHPQPCTAIVPCANPYVSINYTIHNNSIWLFSLPKYPARVFNLSSFCMSWRRKGRTSFSGNVYWQGNLLNCINGNKQNFCRKTCTFPVNVILDSLSILRLLFGVLEKAVLLQPAYNLRNFKWTKWRYIYV